MGVLLSEGFVRFPLPRKANLFALFHNLANYPDLKEVLNAIAIVKASTSTRAMKGVVWIGKLWLSSRTFLG